MVVGRDGGFGHGHGSYGGFGGGWGPGWGGPGFGFYPPAPMAMAEIVM